MIALAVEIKLTRYRGGCPHAFIATRSFTIANSLLLRILNYASLVSAFYSYFARGACGR
jgi:hypothetical protein